MRRLLNLNESSLVFVKIISLLLVLIPAILYAVVLLSSEVSIIRIILMRMIKVSFVAGVFVSIGFLVLIVVEQMQDHYFDVEYKKQRCQKLLLANGDYECQYCGNQKVRKNDKTCSVCGKEFASIRSK